MKPLRSSSRFAILLLIALAACAPGPVPPGPADGQPVTPSLVPVDLAGPEMTVGSSWLYADGSLLVAVPAGMFTMGGGKTDNPPHPVDLPEYWIFRTKVTNAQYAHCVAIGACTPPFARANPGFDDYLHANDPVTGVDYSQAAAYCSFVHARLPTEAEWEKAARGPNAAVYPWGSDAAPACDLLNFDVCVGSTTPVNKYAAGQSYYHAFDMEGNAFEWAADWYQADYYLSSPADNPQGPEKGQTRSVRSSAFNSGGNQTQTFNRFYSRPEDQRANLGFRCVVDDPDYFAPFCDYPATYGTDGMGGANTGEQIQVNCPPFAINQSPGCNGSIHETAVSFTGFQGWMNERVSIHAPFGSCIPNNPLVSFNGSYNYLCHGDGQLQICSECKVTLTTPPQCPDGYTWDPDLKTCLGAASPGACLPGSTPDPAGQCCTFDPGPAAPTADPLAMGGTTNLLHFSPACPPGTWAYWTPDGDHECVSVPVQSPFCVSSSIALLSCNGPNPQQPELSCPAPAGGCGDNYAWDTDLCECVCDGC